MGEVLISVDLGGTNIRAARFEREDGDWVMKQQERTLTEAWRGCESTIERIKNQVRLVFPADGRPVLGIGVSAPGPVNPYSGVLMEGPNLGDCFEVPLKAILQDAFNVPTYLGNDANVAVLAEVALGAARGCREAIFMTVSTGIGTGILTDGRLVLGKEGLGAEGGHMTMIVDGRISTLEKEAAGTAIARKAVERIQAGAATILTDMVSGDLSKISARTVGEAAMQGDALAEAIIRQAGRIVGYGITTLLHLFNPEVVVIGGGVSKIGPLLFDPMHEAIREAAIHEAYWRNLRIVRAELGDDVSIYGAAALVLTQGGVGQITASIRRGEGKPA